MIDLTTALRDAGLAMLASAATSVRKAEELRRSAERCRAENRHALDIAELERSADAESRAAATWQRRAETACAGYFPAAAEDVNDPLYLQRFQDLHHQSIAAGRALPYGEATGRGVDSDP